MDIKKICFKLIKEEFGDNPNVAEIGTTQTVIYGHIITIKFENTDKILSFKLSNNAATISFGNTLGVLIGAEKYQITTVRYEDPKFFDTIREEINKAAEHKSSKEGNTESFSKLWEDAIFH